MEKQYRLKPEITDEQLRELGIYSPDFSPLRERSFPMAEIRPGFFSVFEGGTPTGTVDLPDRYIGGYRIPLCYLNEV